MGTYAYYNVDTGEILSTSEVVLDDDTNHANAEQTCADKNQYLGHSFEVAYAYCLGEEQIKTTTHYLNADKEPVPKTAFPGFIYTSSVDASGEFTGVITGIPVDTRVTWPDGEVTTETDGEVSFTSNVEQVFTFIFHHCHYLEEELEVEYISQ